MKTLDKQFNTQEEEVREAYGRCTWHYVESDSTLPKKSLTNKAYHLDPTQRRRSELFAKMKTVFIEEGAVLPCKPTGNVHRNKKREMYSARKSKTIEK